MYATLMESINDQLWPDFSQNFSCSFEFFCFKLHVDYFVAGVEEYFGGIKRQYDTTSVFA